MNSIVYLNTINKQETADEVPYHNYDLDTRFNPVSVDVPEGMFGYRPQYRLPADEVEEPISMSADEVKYSDRADFVRDLTNAYASALTKAGISTDYAKYLVAQDALESNYGKSYTGRYNYGNITVGSDKTASYTEGADHDANGNPITQKFRNYDSVEDFANAKIALLNGSRYRAFAGNRSAQDFYTRVKNAGYATDPDYVKKLLAVYNSI